MHAHPTLSSPRKKEAYLYYKLFFTSFFIIDTTSCPPVEQNKVYAKLIKEIITNHCHLWRKNSVHHKLRCFEVQFWLSKLLRGVRSSSSVTSRIPSEPNL